jgi:hypothetical protein
MGKYLKYERIHNVYTTSEIENKLKKIIEDDLEIIHYSEKLINESEVDYTINDPLNKPIFLVTIICGKINKGTKQYL